MNSKIDFRIDLEVDFKIDLYVDVEINVYVWQLDLECSLSYLRLLFCAKGIVMTKNNKTKL